jgi:3-oxosteroid 1-dehydrogenase
MTVIMLESTDRWGGSSAMSGGGLWLPNNPLMSREGVSDSREEALTYLEATVGDAGRATSRARKEAFVDGVAGFVTLAERLGVRFARATDYPDYYPELKGGKIGRAIEVEPFDVRGIGKWWATSRGQDGLPAPVMTDDFWLLSRAWSTQAGLARGAKVIVRTLGTLVRRQKAVGMGAAVTASLLQVALRLGVEVRLSSPIDELITEDGRVTGVRTSRGGSPRTIAAARGVILGGGGFDHNVEWRERYQGVTGADSSGASGNVGSAIEVAMKVGAAVDLMEDAWWGGSVPSPAPAGSAMFLVSERSMPHSIIVDAAGHRFANESESYVDLGHHMFEHFQTVPGACWMITDVRHTRRYLRSYAMDPRAVKAMEAAGTMVKAPTLAALAGRIRVDAAALQATVDRFNGFCRAGVDNDFARGNSAYDRYYGDPSVHPNPNLGTIEKGPFAAVQVVPGDLGTKGGLLSDEHARVLREDGSVIEGLYVSGNNSASVMGHTYPGPGSTLGPAAVFGYIAAKHIASN